MKKFVSYVVTFHGKECLLGTLDFIHDKALICSIDMFDDGIYDFGDGSEYFRMVNLEELTDADIRMEEVYVPNMDKK